MTESGVKRRKVDHVSDHVRSNPNTIVLESPSLTSRQTASNGDGADGNEIEDGFGDNTSNVTGRHERSHRQVDRTDAVTQIQEYVGSTSKSNIFRLQVEELLAEVGPGSTVRMETVDKALRKLKSIIEAVPDRPPLSVG